MYIETKRKKKKNYIFVLIILIQNIILEIDSNNARIIIGNIIIIY